MGKSGIAPICKRPICKKPPSALTSSQFLLTVGWGKDGMISRFSFASHSCGNSFPPKKFPAFATKPAI
jgi:hypothetical protein